MRYSLIFILSLLSFAAWAKEEALPLAHNSKQPVEITADALEVFQKERKAKFSGSVEAIQGDMTLKSDAMTVYYTMDSDKTGADKNSVSKVETTGNVRLKTPKESAKGDKGVFDVGQSIITLTGNVEVASGKNMVKGEKLVYNLKTGQSSLVSGSDNTVQGGEVQPVGKKGRVRGVFVPEN